MRPRKPEKSGSGDLLRARLDQIINMRQELVRLADAIDWHWLDGEVAGIDEVIVFAKNSGDEGSFVAILDWHRPTIEAVIGHMKTDGHMGRNSVTGRHGDQANAVLTATGYNLRLMFNRLRAHLRKILEAVLAALSRPRISNSAP